MDKGSENQMTRANEIACIRCNKHMRKYAHVHTLVKNYPSVPRKNASKPYTGLQHI